MIFYPSFGDKEILKLVRFGGPGLGNMLFPYSRAYIYSKRFNGSLGEPIWTTLKLGPLLRNELDSRFYFGLFKSNFLKRLFFSLNSCILPSITEEAFLLNRSSLGKNTVVHVSGLKNFFEDLKGFEQELLDHFYTLLSTNTLKKVNAFDGNTIGVHIRLGDYSEQLRIRLDWYIEKIAELRKIDKFRNLSVTIFSDGQDQELEALLRLPRVQRVKEPDALSDIIRLSTCKIIVGSNSTFSAWGAFLSTSPFLRPDNFYLGRLRKDKNLFEGESFQDDEPSSAQKDN